MPTAADSDRSGGPAAIDAAVAEDPQRASALLASWLEQNWAHVRGHAGYGSESMADAHQADTKLQRVLWDAGWLRLGWPESCGGLGGGPLVRGAVYEGLAAAGLDLPETFAGIETLGNTVLHYAEPLARAELPRVLRGETTWSQGFSEPGAGSDLGSVRTSAEVRDDCFVVNGQKLWTTLGQFSDMCAVLVRTGSQESAHRGLSVLFIDNNSPGLTVSPLRASSGRDEFAEVFFDDVVVPRDRLIGEINGGWGVVMYSLQWERGMYAWQRQAWMHSRLAQALDQAGPRRAAHAAAIGQLYIDLAGLRLKARATLRALAAGANPGPDISIDKILLSKTEQGLLDLADNLLFPDFELGEDELSRRWRREFLYSRVTSIFGGSVEIQRNIVGERVLGLPREPRDG